MPEVFFPLDEAKSLEIAVNRIKKWITSSRDREKLPKSRDALANAVKSMCIVPISITTQDYVFEILKAEGIQLILTKNFKENYSVR